MKKLGKLKLKDFTAINDSEMKHIVGGYGGELPEIYVYGSQTCPQPWHFACLDKSPGNSCSFIDGHKTKYGRCSQNGFNSCKYCWTGGGYHT